MAYCMEYTDFIEAYYEPEPEPKISLELKNYSYDENNVKRFTGKHLVVKINKEPYATIEMYKDNGEFKFKIFSCEKKFKFIPAKRIPENDREQIRLVKDIVCCITDNNVFIDAIKGIFNGTIKLKSNGRGIK